MRILVINSGSSSIKYQLLDLENPQEPILLAKGGVERIGQQKAFLAHKCLNKSVEPIKLETPILDHTVGIELILKALIDDSHGSLKSLEEIKAVGHRVAHGGEYFTKSSIIDAKAKEEIRNLIELAPLHNAPSLKGIESIESILPGVPQVAVFDTSFHTTIPNYNYLYAIPKEFYEKRKVRKYGFHGTSHKFVATEGAKVAGLDINNSKIITCHIGNGASITAVKDGKSFNTSMGFTPLDGLVMGTRSGSIDPGVLMYLMDKEKLSIQKVNDILNKESGMLGLTGISSDMRDIEDAYHEGNEVAIMGFNLYCAKIKEFIGAYATTMNGLDLVVFTGGVGENDQTMRNLVLSNMEFLGIEFDKEANKSRGKLTTLTTKSSKVKVLVVPTDEELVIAKDTFMLVTAK